MTRTPDLLTVNPLFYDALSGEFQPFGSETTHTLGRLMVASFQKGERIIDDPISDSRTHFEIKYSPSWANRVTTTILGEEDERATYIRELQLVEGVRRLMLTHIPEPNKSDFLWLTHKHLDRENPFIDRGLKLELGAELTATKGTVTRAAQEFLATDRINS